MFDQRDLGLELDLAFKSQIDAWSLNLKCLQLNYKHIKCLNWENIPF